MLKEYNLEGKVAIVTGAGRGLGRAIALTLAEAGANVNGVFDCIRAVVPFMIRERKGKVINIISTAAVKYTAFQDIYPATKAAVAAITRCLANKLARFNINVDAIAPGMFATAMLEKLLNDEETGKQLIRTIPLRRFGDPREVGLLALYLASDASNYMTGQRLYIDGGYTVG